MLPAVPNRSESTLGSALFSEWELWGPVGSELWVVPVVEEPRPVPWVVLWVVPWVPEVPRPVLTPEPWCSPEKPPAPVVPVVVPEVLCTVGSAVLAVWEL